MSTQIQVKKRNLIELGDTVYAATVKKTGKVEDFIGTAVAVVSLDRWPDKDDKRITVPVGELIRVEYPRSHNRHYSLTQLTGRPDLVLAHAKYLIDNDHVTQCYEHMRERVQSLNIDDYPASITVVLSKNDYAGD